MKKIIISLLACYTPFIVNATEIVTPDIELGNWVTTTDVSAFIAQALAGVPEATRPMLRKMMEDQMEGANNANQCITKDILANFDKQLKSAFGENQDCKFAVTESSKAKLVASMTCPGSVMKIETLFVNDKLSTSSLKTNAQGMPETTLNMTSKWTSSDCSEGV